MLEVKELTKKFKQTVACKDINFKVDDGEFFVLLGPSGCGKTTVLRLIAGLETLDRGNIISNNMSLNEVDTQDRNVAMVFQNYALYPNMTVRKNLEFPLKMRKTDKNRIPEIIEEIAGLLQMAEFLDKKAVKLSGGQQQRVAVGRALVRKPEIFLLDEPLSNLDAKLRQHLRVELARIHKELNITTVYVTHDQAEAMTLGDRILVLKKGEIQQVGVPEDIYESPANLFVAQFIGFPEINLFETELREGKFKIMGTDAKIKKYSKIGNKKVIAAIRPEDIEIIDSGNGIQAQLEIKEVSGPDTILYLKKDDKQIRLRVSKEKRDLIPEEKEAVELKIEPDKVMLYDYESKKLIKP